MLAMLAPAESYAEDIEVDEETLLKSDTEDNSGDLNKTMSTFRKLVVEKFIEVNESRNVILQSKCTWNKRRKK